MRSHCSCPPFPEIIIKAVYHQIYYLFIPLNIMPVAVSGHYKETRSLFLIWIRYCQKFMTSTAVSSSTGSLYEFKCKVVLLGMPSCCLKYKPCHFRGATQRYGQCEE